MIGLSPLSPGHRRRFQPTCVRPSTGSYPRFSLPRDSSPGFAPTARDSTPCSDSLSLRLASELNLAPHRWLAGSFYKRHAVTACAAPTARGRTVSGAVSLPSRGAFHLSLTVLRYLCAIGRRGVFRVGWWSTQLRTGYPVPGPTRGGSPAPGRGFAYGAVTLCGRPSQAVPPASPGRRGARQDPDAPPRNPGGAKAAARVRSPVCPRPPFARRYSGDLVIDFSSSGYLDVSVPRVALPPPMCSEGG